MLFNVWLCCYQAGNAPACNSEMVASSSVSSNVISDSRAMLPTASVNTSTVILDSRAALPTAFVNTSTVISDSRVDSRVAVPTAFVNTDSKYAWFGFRMYVQVWPFLSLCSRSSDVTRDDLPAPLKANLDKFEEDCAVLKRQFATSQCCMSSCILINVLLICWSSYFFVQTPIRFVNSAMHSRCKCTSFALKMRICKNSKRAVFVGKMIRIVVSVVDI